MITHTFDTADGSKIKAAVISFPRESSETLRLLAGLDRLSKADSQQLAPTDGLKAYYDAYAVEPPLVLPYQYAELYRRDDTMRACVDARVEAVARQGWRIRPRAEVWPSARQQDMGAEVDLDYDLQEKIAAMFEGGLPDYDFSEMLGDCWQDRLCTGNGYVELIRDTKGTLVKLARVPSVTMRIAQYLPGFVQQRGSNKQWFRRYGHEFKAIRLERKDQAALTTKSGQELITPQPLFLPREFVQKAEGEIVSNDFNHWLSKAKKNGDEIFTTVPEVMWFKITSPKDTSYGEPPILSAIESYLGGQNARLFMQSYFDNATVPRMAIFVKGDGSLNSAVLQNIEQWMKGQTKLDALNQTLVCEVGSDSEVQIERLSSEQLKDDGGFIRYKEACSQAIRRAYRTPPSVTFDIENLNNAVSSEADRKFLEFVVRPEQRLIEARFNNLIEREFGSREWVLDLSVPDLTMMAEKRALWDMLLQRGSISVNEVRRELGMPPIAGGNIPILFIPGQGYVPLNAFADPDAVDEMLDESRQQMETSNLQTPADEDLQGKVIAINLEAGRELPPDVQKVFAHVTEQLKAGTPEARATAFPEAFPSDE